MQGYGSKDRKGNLFDDWDLSEAGGSELSEVPVSLLFLLGNSEVCPEHVHRIVQVLKSCNIKFKRACLSSID